MTAKEHADLLNSIQWADECSDTKLCQNDCQLPHGSLFLILRAHKLKVQITTSARIMVHVISHWFHSPSVCLCNKDWFSYTVFSAHRTSSSFRDANMLTAGTGVLTLSAHTTSEATTAGSHWWKKASRMAVWLYRYFFCMVKIAIGHADACLHADGCLHGTSINYLIWVFFYEWFLCPSFLRIQHRDQQTEAQRVDLFRPAAVLQLCCFNVGVGDNNKQLAINIWWEEIQHHIWL